MEINEVVSKWFRQTITLRAWELLDEYASNAWVFRIGKEKQNIEFDYHLNYGDDCCWIYGNISFKDGENREDRFSICINSISLRFEFQDGVIIDGDGMVKSVIEGKELYEMNDKLMKHIVDNNEFIVWYNESLKNIENANAEDLVKTIMVP